jgi:K+-transporting ATPase ATPase C chain
MRHILPALRNYLFITVLVGLLYPLAMTGLAQVFFPYQANGSLIEKDGHVVGSGLLSQKFTTPRYFWPRPSAVDYNPLPSGGSNLGPISADLLKATQDRAKALGVTDPAKIAETVPQELLFASGSGLDPEIDLESALFQVSRVAQARGVPEAAIRSKVQESLEARQLGFLGEERVNVLKLNLALDK